MYGFRNALYGDGGVVWYRECIRGYYVCVFPNVIGVVDSVVIVIDGGVAWICRRVCRVVQDCYSVVAYNEQWCCWISHLVEASDKPEAVRDWGEQSGNYLIDMAPQNGISA